MNLHGIVRGAIRTVNPDISAQYQASTGYSTNGAGKQAPSYAAAVGVQIQVQPVTTKDIERLNNLSLQGVFRRVYAYGNYAAIIRADSKGGDLLTFAEYPGGPTHTWKTTEVAEAWPDWCSVVVTLQAS